jgi:preprotein translocase subunit SecE
MNDFCGHVFSIKYSVSSIQYENISEYIIRNTVYSVYFYVTISFMQMPKTTAINQNFATDLVEELKKVTWPTRKETIRLTTVVIVISLIIGIYIGIIDILMAKGLEILTKFR